MGWLIAGLLLLLLIGGLAVSARAWGRGHEPTDDTLVAELLGDSHPPPSPPPPPSWTQTAVLPAVRPQDRTTAPPDARPQDVRPPEPAAPADEGDWLESQLAWIKNWSEQMHDQFGSGAHADPDHPRPG